MMEKLYKWSERMQGARSMLMALLDRGYVNLGKRMGQYGRGDSKPHHEALKKWLLERLENIDIFLTEPERIRCYDFQKDKKGRCVSCKVTTVKNYRYEK